MFADGMVYTEELLITRLHLSASIVLSLSWLCKWNPIIDWADLTLLFKESLCTVNVQYAQHNFRLKLSSNDMLRQAKGLCTATQSVDPKLGSSVMVDATLGNQSSQLGNHSQVSMTLDEKLEGPPPISLISTVALDQALKQGDTAYYLHIAPCQPNEMACTAKTSTHSPLTPYDDSALKDLIPPKYHNYLDVFTKGSAHELPPH
jgi:hypothetical protein